MFHLVVIGFSGSFRAARRGRPHGEASCIAFNVGGDSMDEEIVRVPQGHPERDAT